MPIIYNTIYLETHLDNESESPPSHQARKRIELTVGDIAESRADLLVSSSAVDRFPSGHVVGSLERYHGESLPMWELYPLKRFTTPRYPNSNMGVWLKRSALSTGQALLVVAMTPRAGFKEGFLAPLDALIEILHQIDQGALSLPNKLSVPFPPFSVALPILGGDRSFHSSDRMRALIEKLSELVHGSSHLEVVSLYVYSRAEADVWSQELERALGRERSKTRMVHLHHFSKTLKDNILTCLDSLRVIPNLTNSKLRHEVLVPLRVHLRHDPTCVATLSTFGRKSWEAIVIHFRELLGRKRESGLTGVFDGLRKDFEARKMISSWVSLSLIKELGNAAAHIQGTNPLSMTDYPILLFALESSLGLVDPFKVSSISAGRESIHTWIEEIEEELTVLLREHGSEYALPALSSLTDDARKEALVVWVDRVMASHQDHPYWQDRGNRKSRNVHLGNLRPVLSDVIPKWVTIHHWLWAFHSIKWEECQDRDWVKLYDTLTRWRLTRFAIDMR